MFIKMESKLCTTITIGSLFILTAITAINGTPKEGKKWVVLVSGSAGWVDYRHQADVARAFQLVKRNGIPEENIIVMMTNDVVNHINNPAKGTMYTGHNVDVYKGIKIDYEGSDVSKDNFFSVLKGDKDKMSKIGSGKVVESGPHDNIFINFVGHGNTGLLRFPRNEIMYADELISTIRELYISRKYGKILMYIEACHSGSMFEGLFDDVKSALAVTAAGPSDAAYSVYNGYSYNGTPYNTELGNFFSYYWMENWEKLIENAPTAAATRTVFNDFLDTRTAAQIVGKRKHTVSKQNPMVYGDFLVGIEKLSSFIGFSYGESSANKTENGLNSLYYDVADLERLLLDIKDPIKRELLKTEIDKWTEEIPPSSHLRPVRQRLQCDRYTPVDFRTNK